MNIIIFMSCKIISVPLPHPSITLFFSFSTPGYFLQIRHVNISFAASISIHDTDLLALFPLDTGCKLNVHKTFIRRPGRLLNVSCTFNLRPAPKGLSQNWNVLSFGQTCNASVVNSASFNHNLINYRV